MTLPEALISDDASTETRALVVGTVTPVLRATLLLVLPSPDSVGSISRADSLSSSLVVVVAIAMSPPEVISLLFLSSNSVVAEPIVTAAESCRREFCHQRLPPLLLDRARSEPRSSVMLPRA